MSPRFEEWLGYLRSDATRLSYGYAVRFVLGVDVDGFLKLAEKDRRGAEDVLIDWVKREEEHLSGTTLHTHVRAVKSLLSYYEVGLNWRRVFGAIPNARRVALDRSPTVEEIRRLLEVCDLRMKCVVLILSSSGVRVGAFDGLKVKDVVFLESGVGRLRVYAGSSDEYYAFISPECVFLVKEYFESRRAVGEELKLDSPLIRDKWNFENRSRKLDPRDAKPIGSGAIKNRVNILWVKCGVRSYNSNGRYSRGEFQELHGFRKWFKTQADQAIRSRDDVEVLMGHILNYYKPSLQHLEEEYLKAIPYLTVSETLQMKIKVEEQEKEFNEESRDLKLKLLEQHQQIEALDSTLKELSDRQRFLEEELKIHKALRTQNTSQIDSSCLSVL